MHTATRGPGRRKHHYGNSLNINEVGGDRFLTDWFHSSPGVDYRADPGILRQTETSANPGRGGGGQTHHQEGHQAHYADTPHPPLHNHRRHDSYPLRLLLGHKAASRSAGHGGHDGRRLVELCRSDFYFKNKSEADNVTDQHQEETSQVPNEID